MNKIQSREYTEKEQGRLKPTELGFIVTDMLEASFKDVVNVGFTAAMEDDLELVAESKKDWKALLKDFWKDFHPTLQTAEETAFVPRLETDLICPKCGNKLQKVWFKNKYFLGCSTYPTCDFTSSVEEFNFDKSEYADDFDWEQKCPKCSSEMKLRFGKFGPFLGCMNYPECKGIVNIPKKGESNIQNAGEKIPCPAIGCTGQLTQKRSRYGKLFYSCTEYPDCDVIGNELDAIMTKYEGREKTAYVKKAKRFSKKVTETEQQKQKKEATMATKKAAKKPAKKAAAKKPAAKKKSSKK
jgi:DNA topoisomerase-1